MELYIKPESVMVICWVEDNTHTISPTYFFFMVQGVKSLINLYSGEKESWDKDMSVSRNHFC